MAAARSLKDVVRNGLCAGCGLCESFGGERLPMRLNEEGFLRPHVPDDVDPDLEARVLEVCPGLNQLGPQLARTDALWGPIEEVSLGHAVDEALRYAASSAGVCSAAAAFLIETGRADAVLHVGADPKRPVRSRSRVSRTRGEVVAQVGARYGPAGPLSHLHRLLDSGERIVVLGKPCDIAAVHALARRDARVDRQVVATISFLCAGLPSHTVSQGIIAKFGLGEDEVSLLRYRGHGCPGPTRIETIAGAVHEQTYLTTWSEELNQSIQFRCKICPDSTGEQADLVCGDAWDGGEGYPLRGGEGWSVILARTARGKALLGELRQAGRVSTEPMPLERLFEMQPHHARRKAQILARLLAMALARQPLPRYRGLGLWRAALKGLRRAPDNVRGMLRRLKRGNNKEHLPPWAPIRSGLPARCEAEKQTSRP